jgi:D-alanyl-D-alanine carboxypeptidase
MTMNRRSLDRAVDYLGPWLAYRRPYANVTGYGVAISWRGELVFNEAFGYANMREKVPLTPGHIFRVASHSKSFTATAVMQLAETGRLRLDDPVVAFLPWLSAHRDRRLREVTLRLLLSHGAGITRDGRDCDFWQLERPFPDAAQLRHEVFGAPLVTEANTALKYSNIGYSLLGMVVEEASGGPYTDYVMEHIVEPLGLRATGPEWKGHGRSAAVTGHTRRDANGDRKAVPVVDTRSLSTSAAVRAWAPRRRGNSVPVRLGSGGRRVIGLNHHLVVHHLEAGSHCSSAVHAHLALEADAHATEGAPPLAGDEVPVQTRAALAPQKRCNRDADWCLDDPPVQLHPRRRKSSTSRHGGIGPAHRPLNGPTPARDRTRQEPR